jgi:hypothetical protein
MMLDEPTPIHPASALPDPEYDYFSTSPQERLPILNKMIAEREERLFELELAEMSLDGNPAKKQSMSHDDFATLTQQSIDDAAKAGKKFVQQQICPCISCQLDQVRDSKLSLIYSLNKLRALASTMTGKSKP